MGTIKLLMLAGGKMGMIKLLMLASSEVDDPVAPTR